MEDALTRFQDRLQEAIDWAVQDGLTIEDMQREFREIMDNMDRYPNEYRPIQ